MKYYVDLLWTMEHPCDGYLHECLYASWLYNASVGVAIGVGHPWCIILSAISLFSIFTTIDWDFYIMI